MRLYRARARRALCVGRISAARRVAGDDTLLAHANAGQVAGRTRVPDGLTSTVLSEVKNVRYQSLTHQLREAAGGDRAVQDRCDAPV